MQIADAPVERYIDVHPSQNDFYCQLKLYNNVILLNLARVYVIIVSYIAANILENYMNARSLFVISQLSIHDNAKCAVCLATLVDGCNVQLLRLLQKLFYHGMPFLRAVLGVPYDYLFHILFLSFCTFSTFCCKRFSGMLCKIENLRYFYWYTYRMSWNSRIKISQQESFWNKLNKKVNVYIFISSSRIWDKLLLLFLFHKLSLKIKIYK